MPYRHGHDLAEVLDAADRGEIPPRVLAEVLLRHLQEVCPHCRQELGRRGIVRRVKATTALSLAVLEAVLGRFVADLDRQEREAARDLRELLALPAEERAGRVSRAHRRFAGGVLADALLARSREALSGSAEESAHLAELAWLVLRRSPSSPETFRRMTLALAGAGNAVRAGGNPSAAVPWFDRARAIVRAYEVTDPGVLARVADLEGSLYTNLRIWARAAGALGQAAELYKLIPEPERTRGRLRVRIKQGELAYHEGRLELAAQLAGEVLYTQHETVDSRLSLFAGHNLCLYTVEAGRAEEAGQMLRAIAAFYSRFPSEPEVSIRFDWLRGRVAEGKGRTAEAEARYLAVREAFIARGNAYDAAWVATDLALLYGRSGRMSDLRQAAEDLAAIAASHSMGQETAAALLLYRDAVRAETATVALAVELRDYLRLARGDHSLAFRRSA